MNLSFYPAPAIVAVVLLAMLFFFYIGRRLFVLSSRRNAGMSDTNLGAVQGSLLGLLALLLAFTFSMSNSHYDRRIQVINDEANNISTAILRADLYPDSTRQAFRKDFSSYLETRIRFFDAGADTAKALQAFRDGAHWQSRLWARAASYARDPAYVVPSNQMLPALNAMFDITITRNTALRNKVPDIIFWVLILLCLTSAFTMGYAQGARMDVVMNLGFAIMISLALYLILDLDRARRGVINVNFVQQEIVNLRVMLVD
jgi:hypothetical protein